MKRYLLLGTVVTAIAASLGVAAPEPAIVQRPGQWTLDVQYTHPQQMVLPWGPNGEQRFWYAILTVTNRTGMDVDFFPKADLMTDTFRILPAGRGVPPVVFDMIKQRHAARYPFLEPLAGIDNRLLEGEDNARDVAIIWRDFDPQATSIKIFISGLSNETAVVPHPVSTDENGRPLPVYLRKTLELNYGFRGDPAFRQGVEIVFRGQNWVMR
jgi:hypothetical protein